MARQAIVIKGGGGGSSGCHWRHSPATKILRATVGQAQYEVTDLVSLLVAQAAVGVFAAEQVFLLELVSQVRASESVSESDQTVKAVRRGGAYIINAAIKLHIFEAACLERLDGPQQLQAIQRQQLELVQRQLLAGRSQIKREQAGASQARALGYFGCRCNRLHSESSFDRTR
eukprot:scaffold12089_cov176-Ochromonas_danica.AAC.3